MSRFALSSSLPLAAMDGEDRVEANPLAATEAMGNAGLLNALLEIERRTSMQNALIRSIETERDQLRADLRRVESENAVLRQEADELLLLKDKVSVDAGSRGALTLQISTLEQTLSRTQSSYEEQISSLRSSLYQFEKQREKEREEELLQRKERERERERWEKERESLKRREMELVKDLAAVKEEFTREREHGVALQLTIEKFYARETENGMNEASLAAKCESLELGLESAEERATSASFRLQQLESENHEMAIRIRVLENDVSKTRQLTQIAREDRDNVARELDLMKMELEALQKEQASVRAQEQSLDETTEENRRVREKLTLAETKLAEMYELQGAMQTKQTVLDREVFIALSEVTAAATRRLASWRGFFSSVRSLLHSVSVIEQQFAVGRLQPSVLKPGDTENDGVMMEQLDLLVCSMNRLCGNESADGNQRLEAIAKAVSQEQSVLNHFSDRLEECSNVLRWCDDMMQGTSVDEVKVQQRAAMELSSILQNLYSRATILHEAAKVGGNAAVQALRGDSVNNNNSNFNHSENFRDY